MLVLIKNGRGNVRFEQTCTMSEGENESQNKATLPAPIAKVKSEIMNGAMP